MMRRALFLALALVLAPPGVLRGETSRYSQRELLANWALSRCLAAAYPSLAAKEDAEVSASGYLEFGKAPIEAYEKIEALVKKALAEKYESSLKSDLNTMKCIDLYHSAELRRSIDASLREIVRAPRRVTR